MPSPQLIEVELTQSNKLSEDDQALLLKLEAKVEKSAMAFCVALADIRDYKAGAFWEGYSNFNEYVLKRFGYQAQHAGRLVATGCFVKKLKDAGCKVLPLRESQARHILTKVPGDLQAECWEKITKKRPLHELTGDIIEAEVIAFRKTISPAILKAAKPNRAPKQKRPPQVERARTKCFDLVKKLKEISQNLPTSSDISDLWDELKILIDRNK